MRKIYLIFIFFSVYSNAQLQGQPKIDSLLIALKTSKVEIVKVDILNAISQEYVNINPLIGIKYAKQSSDLSLKINYNNGLGDAYRCIANNSEGKKSLEYFNKALVIAKKTKFLKLEGAIYSNLAVYYSYESQYKKALEYNFKALNLHELQKDNIRIAGTYVNIGFLYNDLKQSDKALLYFNKALEKNKLFNNPLMKAVIMGNISGIYEVKGEFKKAIIINNQTLKTYRELKLLNYVSVALASLASCNYSIKNYDLSEKYSLEAIEICKKTGVNRAMSISLSNLSLVYLLKYNDKNALVYYKNKEYLKKVISQQILAIQTDKEVEDIRAMSENYQILSNAYELSNDNKNALISQRLYTKFKDSVFNSENKETIKNLEDKREIELRDKEIKINKLSLDAKEKQKWYLFGGLGLLTVIGGLLFYQNRKRKQINSKLEILNQDLDQANQTKIRFFNILNHDLRGPVSNLIDFLQIQKDSPDLLDEATKNRIQDTTLSSAENLLVSMEDILLWSKGQMQNFKPQPKQVAVNQLFDDTKKMFSGYIKIKFEYQNPENLEVFTDENYLKTIIRNLTSNAINVFTTTQNPTIKWKAWQESGKSYLSITDNGLGASQENFKALYDDTRVVGITTGLGLHLIRDLAKAIDCEISVDSQVGVGTIFVLNLQ